jgi:hypothetical protein
MYIIRQKTYQTTVTELERLQSNSECTIEEEKLIELKRKLHSFVKQRAQKGKTEPLFAPDCYDTY